MVATMAAHVPHITSSVRGSLSLSRPVPGRQRVARPLLPRPSTIIRATPWADPTTSTSTSTSTSRSFSLRDDGAAGSLPNSLRKAIESSITARRGELSVGDAAADAGVSLFDAQRALSALALDAGATLQVSDDGDVLYVFSRDFTSRIAAKSLKVRLTPALTSTVAVARYLFRASFGVALLGSVAVTTAAVVAILTSSRRDNDDRPVFRGDGLGVWRLFRVLDLLTWFDPRYSPYGYYRDPAEMSFLEAVGSVLWGDGDPGATFGRQRLAQAGKYIQRRGGVVTSAELVPFLEDLTPKEVQQLRTAVQLGGDEAEAALTVLPSDNMNRGVAEIMVYFGGEPCVTEDGSLLLTFPSLQATGGVNDDVSHAQIEPAMRPNLAWSRAQTGQRVAAFGIGMWNFFMVGTLSYMLSDPRLRYQLMRSGLNNLVGAMPYLQVFAVAFFVVPLVRWYFVQRKNRRINDGNRARAEGAALLDNPVLRERRALASKYASGQVRRIQEGEVAYRSNVEVDETRVVEAELEAFDRRLQRREGA